MKVKEIITVAIILLIAGFLAGFFVKRPTYKVPEGKVLVTQNFLDSLTYIANLPPTVIVKDTVIKDTVWIPVTTEPDFVPNPDIPQANIYTDHLLVEDTIDVKIQFKSTGELIGGIEWMYKPIFHIKEITIEKPAPYPVIQEVLVTDYRTGWYLSGSFGTENKGNEILFGANLDIVGKNSYIYGLEYRRLAGTDFYGIKLGINLNKLFR